MDGFELNKIIAAVLVALLTAKVADIMGDWMLHKDGHLTQQAFVIEGAEHPTATADAGPQKPTGPEDIKALLATADVANGEKVFKKCAVCHSAEKGGPNKVGPDLWEIINRPKAHAAGFAYSSAMQAKGGNWGYEDLNVYLFNPKADVPGTKMSFAGISNTKDRADLIAYLRSKADSPVALPK